MLRENTLEEEHVENIDFKPKHDRIRVTVMKENRFSDISFNTFLNTLYFLYSLHLFLYYFYLFIFFV